MKDLKARLDSLYKSFDFAHAIKEDPVHFPHRYRQDKDIEVSGFIASSFAYGNIRLFMPVIEKILNVMGKHPYEFLVNFSIQKHACLFQGIRYRFQKTEDIIAFLYVISVMLKRYGSIYKLFKRFYRDEDPDIGSALLGMMADIRSSVNGGNVLSRGFLQLFPSPSGGSAFKRANLFLRWMVRDRDIDFGIWKGIPKNKLIIPLDTHIARLGSHIGLTTRTTNDWKMAVEISSALKKIDPEDPLKYDFVLCHTERGTIS
ncbi:MAG: TIGR02757 family protein [Nitrospirae bacterium]|nr:TIGR02757 family protein [Nitrospirota bacterium]